MASSYIRVMTNFNGVVKCWRKYGGNKSSVRRMWVSYDTNGWCWVNKRHPHMTVDEYNTLYVEGVKLPHYSTYVESTKKKPKDPTHFFNQKLKIHKYRSDKIKEIYNRLKPLLVNKVVSSLTLTEEHLYNTLLSYSLSYTVRDTTRSINIYCNSNDFRSAWKDVKMLEINNIEYFE